ncbi:MAG TPA: DUF1192 family protein [Micavibrio sp.]|jgi:uncharacterized small protein (DUF1192 family)
MLFDDENTPQNQPKKKRVLDKMSVEELRQYIDDMKEEISRVEQEIARKKAHAAAAASIFKS